MLSFAISHDLFTPLVGVLVEAEKSIPITRGALISEPEELSDRSKWVGAGVIAFFLLTSTAYAGDKHHQNWSHGHHHGNSNWWVAPAIIGGTILGLGALTATTYPYAYGGAAYAPYPTYSTYPYYVPPPGFYGAPTPSYGYGGYYAAPTQLQPYGYR